MKTRTVLALALLVATPVALTGCDTSPPTTNPSAPSIPANPATSTGPVNPAAPTSK